MTDEQDDSLHRKVVSLWERKHPIKAIDADLEGLIAEAREVVNTAMQTTTVTPEGRDRAAELDEAVFRDRFNFAASAEQRRQILKLKNECDVTDEEITLLKRAGSLRYEADQATIDAGVWRFAYGAVQILFLAVFSIAILLKTGFGHLKSTWLIPVPIALLVGFAYLIVMLEKCYLRPYRIFRRTVKRNI